MTLIYEPTMFTGRHTGQGGYSSHNLPPNISYPTPQCSDYSYGEQLPQGTWMYPTGPGRGHPDDPWTMLQSGGFGATGHHHQSAYTRSPPVNPPDFVRGHGAIVPNPAASGSSSTGSLPMPTHTVTDSGNRPLRGGPPYDWIKKSPNPDDLGQHQGYKPGKTRTRDKYRVVYSDHQRLELEKEFHYSKYITIRRKSELAQALQLSERQVKIWFQNRRAKERKMSKKKDDIISKQTVDHHGHQVTHASAIAAPTIVHGQHPLHG